MTVLKEILQRVYIANKGTSLLKLNGIKETYMLPLEHLGESITNAEGKRRMVENRLKLRMYLRELHLYT